MVKNPYLPRNIDQPLFSLFIVMDKRRSFVELPRWLRGGSRKRKICREQKKQREKSGRCVSSNAVSTPSSPNPMSDHPVTLEIGNYFLSNCTTCLHLAILDKIAKCSTIPGNFCTNHPWGKMVISKTCLDTYQAEENVAVF